MPVLVVDRPLLLQFLPVFVLFLLDVYVDDGMTPYREVVVKARGETQQ